MSLLIWLPLQGDNHNQGLLDVTVQNAGTVSYVDGKLGKSLQAGVSTQTTNGLVIDTNLVEELGEEYSVAAWVRPNGTHVHYNGSIMSSGNWNVAKGRWTFGVSQDNTKVDVFGPNHNVWIDCSVPVGEWTHLVSTQKDGIAYLYKNGEYVGQKALAQAALFSSESRTCIGRESYAGGYFSFNGNICDLRVYDHCLSTREVKELAKGLVAHWKLDDPYVEATQNLVTSSTTGYGQITRVGDTLVTSGENKDTYFRLSLGAALVAGTTYTVSMYCRGMADGGTATFGVGAQSGDNRAALWIVQNGHNECTFIVPTGLNGATSIMFDDTNRMGLIDHQAVFSQIQVEQKDHATGYIAWGTSRAKGAVYDSSGYCHDGTLSPTPPTFDSDSARYSGCLNFVSASTNYIDCGIDIWLPTDQITVAWWGYMTTWGSTRPISCTESGGWNFEAGTGGGFRFPVYKKGLGYAYGTPVKKWADYTSGWHFFVGTFDGYITKIYVDGEFDSESTNATPATKAEISYYKNAKLFIGCEANSASPSSPYFNGKLSDIRIYATALSADDIKELYNTSASIDDHHNVYAREFVED